MRTFFVQLQSIASLPVMRCTAKGGRISQGMYTRELRASEMLIIKTSRCLLEPFFFFFITKVSFVLLMENMSIVTETFFVEFC